MNLAGVIDHTVLKPDCRISDIKLLCEEAVQLGFFAVCLPPFYVQDAARILKNSNIKVATVIGFPNGYAATAAKVEEIKRAIDEGADELDVVINICAVKDGKWNFVRNDIESMTLATHSRGKVLKVILETGLLTKEEMLRICDICSDVKVNFVKTSTGINGAGASESVVRLLRAHLPQSIKIKASGGIRNAQDAQSMMDAGASRIGTSSGVEIVTVRATEG